MKNKKVLSTSLSLGLSLALLIGNVSGNMNNVKAKEQGEKKQIYMIQASSERVLEKTLEKYGEVKTVAEVSKDELGHEGVATVSLSKREAEELEESNHIVTIEKDKKVMGSKVKKINRKKIDLEWNKKLIKSENDKNVDSKEKVKIAVIDSGVDWGNDIDLEETITLVPGEEEMSPLFMDGSGHGNSVAGLIAAKDNDEGITGINPNAAIYSIRVLDDNNEAPLSRVIDGIYYAISKKVDIINMSFGLDSYSESLKKAVDTAEDAGILVIAAAGNTGDNVQYPAAYDNVLSVGSVDSDAELAKSSARGDKIDVVAPGELVCTTGQFGDLLVESGTSLAAPQVAGVASKIMEANPNASYKDVKKAIVNGANYNKCGYGLLDEEYTVDNYNKLVMSVKKNNSMTNKTKVETVEDTGCVKGSWSIANHERLIGSDHSYVKEGARYPDISTNTKGLSGNPWWHGGYHSNYVASYIYATKIAEKLGKGKSVSSATIDHGLSNVEKSHMKNSVSLWANNTSNYSKGQKRAFVWGMAAHTAADVFAHSAYVRSGNAWCHLAHGGNHNNIKYNDYADKPNKYGERFTAAKNVVKKIIQKYDAKSGEGSCAQFKAMTSVGQTFRLRNLCKYIETMNSSTKADDFKCFNVSSGPYNEYWVG